MKAKTLKEHKKMYFFLCLVTYILFFPFVILNYIYILLELILDFVNRKRNKMVYRIMEFLYESRGRRK